MPDKPKQFDTLEDSDPTLDRAVAILRDDAEARAHLMREKSAEPRAPDNRAELERELATLQARLDRWETQSAEPPSPRKLEMIRMGKVRALALADAIRKLEPAAQ